MNILNQKIVFISGSRSGIGRSTAILMAKKGARLLLHCRKKGDTLDLIEEIKQYGGQAKEISGDLSKLSNITKLAKSITDVWGRVDIMINNAATISPMSMLGNLDIIELEKSMNVNLTAQLALISELWTVLSNSKARIINILSGASINPRKGWSIYCTSKAAFHMLTKQINLEGKEEGIKCFGFSPGLVRTNMQIEIRKSKINEISFLPENNMIDPIEPAKCILSIASGEFDNFDGDFMDIRDEIFNKIISHNLFK